MTIQNPKSKIKNGLLTLAGLSLLAVGGPVVEKTEEGNRLYQDGKFDEAARIAEKALNAARISGRENLIVDIQKRIELYQAGMRDRQR